jgi:predicted nucleic acid-binding Zn finger protein
MTKDFLKYIRNKVEEKGIIDEEIIKLLDEALNEGAERVLESVKRGITIYKYQPSQREFWTAMGENREHIIYPGIFCSCNDFYKEVVINRSRSYCKHLISQVICEVLNKYEIKVVDDKQFKEMIDDILLELKF